MNNNYEFDYRGLLSYVLNFGEKRTSRAGNTIALFGTTLQVTCLRDGLFPILTARKMFPRPVFGELAAFLTGATDLRTFKDFDCNYWDSNAKAWSGNLGLPKDQWQVGQIYGAQWRSWRGKGYDQLKMLITSLKEDPYSRRHLLTTYDPEEKNACLPPCHLLAQFNVTNNGYLDCCVYMRSVDLCLGLPSDVILYATLMLVIAQQVDLQAGILTFMLGDTHIYENHLPSWEKQAKAETYNLPTYSLTKAATISSFSPGLIQLHNYQHGEKLEYPFNV